ncbi:MAG: hypothetical protein KIS66_16295 [Fimbriimonadaceae bacterium]|nr:hypothetical protein [Fimbriimonadaceae bacterium]
MPRISYRGNARANAAYTLVELAVVVAVLLALVGLLVPVLGEAKRNGKSIACLTHTRQVGLSILLYAQDFDDCLPWAASENSKWQIAHFGSLYNDATDALIPFAPPLSALLGTRGLPIAAMLCPLEPGPYPGLPPAGTYGTSTYYQDQVALRGFALGSADSPSEAYLIGDYGPFHAPSEGAARWGTIALLDGHARVTDARTRHIAVANLKRAAGVP